VLNIKFNKIVIPFQLNKNLFIYSFITFIALLWFQSCNETPTKSSTPQPTQTLISLEEAIEEKATITNYAIPPEFSKWDTYHPLYIDIKNLENDALDLFSISTENLDQLFLDIRKSIPNNLNETSILTRFSVIETLTHKLRESYMLDHLDSKKFTQTKTELIQAQTNLIFQINRTLEKKAQQITKPI
tara:strand:+ start:325 stop:885 length:561 start_codon:yes stop_codon:yes gene_type:complete